VILIGLASAALAHIPVVWITTPDEDWCAVINGVEGGDVVMFVGGDYHGPCDIVASAPVIGGEITIIESLDPQNPAIFRNGGGDYIFSVTGPAVTLMLMDFTEVPAGTAAIELRGGETTAVRFNHFYDIEGDAIRTTGSVEGLSVNDNDFLNLGGSVVNMGCMDGSCVVGGGDVFENLVIGAGSGFALGPGSAGFVTDNTLSGLAGVGIEVAASVLAWTVSENFVEGASDALVLDGTAELYNNIAVGARSLVSRAAADQKVQGNTLVGAVSLVGWGADPGQVFANNAVVGGVPSPGGETLAGGNVDCSDTSSCFYDALGRDYYPVPDAMLRSAGEEIGEDLISDWCGRARERPPTAGALEAASVLSFGPVELIQKDEFFCVLPDDPIEDSDIPTAPATDTGSSETEDPVKKKRRATSGCGCATGPGGGSWVVLLLAAAVIRRRVLVAGLFIPGVAGAHIGQIFTIGPDEDWCTFINEEVLPGDLIFLLPGEYEGPCEWVAREPTEIGEINMLQSTDVQNPAILTAPAGSDYILSVTGTRVSLLHLWFQEADVETALALDAVTDVEVRFGHFVDIGGDAVRIGDTDDVRVADSEFRRVSGAAVTVGCEDGGCSASELLLADLLVEDAAAGVRVHPGSAASLYDSVFAEVPGGALVYRGDLGLVSGNLFWSPVAVEGSVSLRNNIVADGVVVDTEATGLSLIGNALLGGMERVRTPESWTFLGNAVEGAEPLEEGNVACPVVSDCWEDAAGGDFRPVVDSALLDQGVSSGLLTDFCGSEREAPHAIGALERTETAAPLGVAFKKLQVCVVPDFVPSPDEGGGRKKRKASQCGCVAGAPRGPWLGWLGLLVLLRRVRFE